jgi:hypothetical protein
MFRNKVSHAKSKKNEVNVNMVLDVTTKSQNPRLVLLREKELQNNKTAEDWEKEEQLQKTFKSIIQQM